jgi:hypothetical protein
MSVLIETREDAERVVDEALRESAATARSMLQKVKWRRKVWMHEGGYGFGWVEIRPARGKLVSELKRRGIGHSIPGHGFVVDSGEIDGLPERLRGDQVTGAWWLVKAVAESFASVLVKHGVDARARNRGD